jgi:hypothetical protein
MQSRRYSARDKTRSRCDTTGTFPGSDYTDEQVEFLKAITKFKQHWKCEPTVRDVLAIVRELGYRRVG